jgi:hypothetical protein
MPNSKILEAIAVLNAALHRGACSWHYDDTCQRIMPEGWNGLEEAAPPSFTVFEALAVADRLARIGAGNMASVSRA